MHREKPILFTAQFMKKYGIKPFPVETQTMDLEGEFIQELMDSLKAGYDSTKPILVAKCEGDDRIDGYPVDGRHRLYCLAKLKERDVPLPNPFPIAFIDVKDANQLRALIAEFEQKNRSKGAKYAKAQIEKNLKGIIDDNIEVQGVGKMHDFLKSLGFTNDAIINHVVDDYMGEPGKVKKEKQKRDVVGLPESLKNSWNADSSVYADKEERLDAQISYQKCPDCDHLLAITTDLKGAVLSVKSAAKAASTSVKKK
jgi:hypothetical protein